MHQSIFSGWTLVIPKVDPETFCATIQARKITFAYVVPPVVLMLVKQPIIDKYDICSLRMMNSSAAPLTQEIVTALDKRTKVPVKQGYGLGEMNPGTHTQPWEEWQTTIGSVRQILPNQTAKCMSDAKEEVPVGQTVELRIKGPNTFQGYLNNPIGTANALTPNGYFKISNVGH